MTITHPDAADLHAFAVGALADDSFDSVAEHLRDCDACREAVAASPGDTLVSLLRNADTEIDLPVPAAEPPQDLADHPRYRLLKILGVGGMGTVWLAEHRVMGRRVALKVIRPEYLAKPGAVERFRREVAAASRLHHSNIVTAFDAEQAGTTHFLVMEYVEGTGLDEVLKERGALPVAEASSIIRQAAEALDEAHRAGLVHRDVKPGNLMLCPDGRVKMLDFGLAMIVADERADMTLTGANLVVGTPDSIAPEQAEHPHAADARADIYSLGCTLYHLLAGQPPFPGVSVLKKLDAHRYEQPKPLSTFRSDIPQGLQEIVSRMMAKDPANRYQRAAAVADALRLQPATISRKPRNRVRTLVAACSFLFLLAAGIVTYRIQTDKGELVITTHGDDVEVVVKQGGKLVSIIDTKTQKRLELRSGEYDLELKNAEGLSLDIKKATLSRGKETLATIERIDVPRQENAMIPPPRWDFPRDLRALDFRLKENQITKADYDSLRSFLELEEKLRSGRMTRKELDAIVTKSKAPEQLKAVVDFLTDDLLALNQKLDKGQLTKENHASLQSQLLKTAFELEEKLRKGQISKAHYDALRSSWKSAGIDHIPPPLASIPGGASPSGAPGMMGPGSFAPPPVPGQDPNLSVGNPGATSLGGIPGLEGGMPGGMPGTMGGAPDSTQPAKIWPPKELPKPGFMVRLDIAYATARNMLHFSPDNRLIAVDGGNWQYIPILEAATGKAVNDRFSAQNVHAVAFTTDSQRLIAAVSPGSGLYKFEQWDIQTGKRTTLIPTIRMQSTISAIQLTPDMKRLVVTSAASYVVFDVAEGRIVHHVAAWEPARGGRGGFGGPGGQPARTVNPKRLVSADGSRLFSLRTENISEAKGPSVLKTSLCMDDLSKPAGQVRQEVMDNAFALFESKGDAFIGVLYLSKTGRVEVATFDPRTLKPVASHEIPDLGPGLPVPTVAPHSARAVFEFNTGFEAVDLSGDFKRSPIANLPNHDALVLSDDGQVFAARTETGWNLYRLPGDGTALKKPALPMLPGMPPGASGTPHQHEDPSIPPLPLPGEAGGSGTPGQDAPAAFWPPGALPKPSKQPVKLPIEYSTAMPVHSPDGRLVGVLRPRGFFLDIFDTATGKMIASRFRASKNEMPDRPLIQAWCFSPDESKVLLALKDGNGLFSFEEWDIQTGKARQVSGPIRFPVEISSIQWSADKTRIIVGGKRVTYVWDVAKAKIAKEVRHVLPSEKGVVALPSDLRQAFVSADGNRMYRLHAAQIESIVFIRLVCDSLMDDSPPVTADLDRATWEVSELPDGRLCLVATQGKSDVGISLADAKTLRIVAGPATEKTFGDWTVSTRGPVAVRSLPTGKFSVIDLAGARTVPYDSPTHSFQDLVAVSAGGQILSVRTETGWCMHALPEVGLRKSAVDPSEGKHDVMTINLAMPCEDFRFSADGKLWLTGSGGNLVTGDSAGNWMKKHVFAADAKVAPCLMPDGKLLVAYRNPNADKETKPYLIEFRDPRTGDATPTKLVPRGEPLQCVPSSDGGRLYVLCEFSQDNFGIDVFEIETGKVLKSTPLKQMKAAIDWQTRIAPNGQFLVSFASRRKVDSNRWEELPESHYRIDDVTDVRVPQSKEGVLRKGVRDIAFLPDGKSFLALTRDEADKPVAVRSIEIPSGKEQATPPIWMPETIVGGKFAFSMRLEPQKAWNVVVHDKPTFQPDEMLHFQFPVATKPGRIVLAPDGKHVAVLMSDKTIIQRIGAGARVPAPSATTIEPVSPPPEVLPMPKALESAKASPKPDVTSQVPADASYAMVAKALEAMKPWIGGVKLETLPMPREKN